MNRFHLLENCDALMFSNTISILYLIYVLTFISENLFFRGLWLMLEGGLMKFLAKGATEKIVEDADEKRERLSNHN